MVLRPQKQKQQQLVAILNMHYRCNIVTMYYLLIVLARSTIVVALFTLVQRNDSGRFDLPGAILLVLNSDAWAPKIPDENRQALAC